MSLDARIREGLDAAARPVDPDVEAHLGRSRTLARRRIVVRRTTWVLAVAASLTAAVLIVPAALDRWDASRLPGTPVPSVAPLDVSGTWQTTEISTQQVSQTLRAAGLDDYVDDVALDPGFPTHIRLVFSGSHFSTFNGVDGNIDDGTYTLAGSTLTLVPSCPCTITYAVQIDGDRMTLTLLADTSPDYNGIPDEAFQRAIYTSAPFQRS